jgi:hypothetical protein
LRPPSTNDFADQKRRQLADRIERTDRFAAEFGDCASQGWGRTLAPFEPETDNVTPGPFRSVFIGTIAAATAMFHSLFRANNSPSREQLGMAASPADHEWITKSSPQEF